jgi:hypothetical protein
MLRSSKFDARAFLYSIEFVWYLGKKCWSIQTVHNASWSHPPGTYYNIFPMNDRSHQPLTFIQCTGQIMDQLRGM